MEKQFVYMDYAATSAIRPPEVADAVHRFLTDVGATPGRAGHRRSVEAGRLVLRCRVALAELLGIGGDPGRIAFQMNATHALNTALFGTLGPGDAVVCTAYDHNSVRRPLAVLATRGVEVREVSGRADGGVDLAEVGALLEAGPRPARLLVVPHASNVTGVALPVRAMAELARAAGARVLVDAAQSVGHLPVQVDTIGADLLAVTGHKGLLGPQGVGALWVREGVTVEPLLHGGTGSRSESARMPDAYPDHLEAGSQNAPGIAGLLAGVEWLLAEGVGRLHAREMAHRDELRARLAKVAGLSIRSPDGGDGVPLVTVTSGRVAPQEMARRLDSECGIQARAGLHCAPGAHRAIGTLRTGALRLSLGWASTSDDVRRAASALATITEINQRQDEE